MRATLAGAANKAGYRGATVAAIVRHRDEDRRIANVRPVCSNRGGKAGKPVLDKRLRNLLLICLSSAAWSFGFGMGTQLVTHWLRARDQSETEIGLNHACHYLG